MKKLSSSTEPEEMTIMHMYMVVKQKWRSEHVRVFVSAVSDQFPGFNSRGIPDESPDKEETRHPFPAGHRSQPDPAAREEASALRVQHEPRGVERGLAPEPAVQKQPVSPPGFPYSPPPPPAQDQRGFSGPGHYMNPDLLPSASIKGGSGPPSQTSQLSHLKSAEGCSALQSDFDMQTQRPLKLQAPETGITFTPSSACHTPCAVPHTGGLPPEQSGISMHEIVASISGKHTPVGISTGKDTPVPMQGYPHHQTQNHLSELLSQGNHRSGEQFTSDFASTMTSEEPSVADMSRVANVVHQPVDHPAVINNANSVHQREDICRDNRPHSNTNVSQPLNTSRASNTAKFIKTSLNIFPSVEDNSLVAGANEIPSAGLPSSKAARLPGTSGPPCGDDPPMMTQDTGRTQTDGHLPTDDVQPDQPEDVETSDCREGTRRDRPQPTDHPQDPSGTTAPHNVVYNIENVIIDGEGNLISFGGQNSFKAVFTKHKEHTSRSDNHELPVGPEVTFAHNSEEGCENSTLNSEVLELNHSSERTHPGQKTMYSLTERGNPLIAMGVVQQTQLSNDRDDSSSSQPAHHLTLPRVADQTTPNMAQSQRHSQDRRHSAEFLEQLGSQPHTCLPGDCYCHQTFPKGSFQNPDTSAELGNPSCASDLSSFCSSHLTVHHNTQLKLGWENQPEEPNTVSSHQTESSKEMTTNETSQDMTTNETSQDMTKSGENMNKIRKCDPVRSPDIRTGIQPTRLQDRTRSLSSHAQCPSDPGGGRNTDHLAGVWSQPGCLMGPETLRLFDPKRDESIELPAGVLLTDSSCQQ
ncbi:hypothetical protein ACOMHN_060255 [Nucella lapillus]